MVNGQKKEKINNANLLFYRRKEFVKKMDGNNGLFEILNE